MNKMDSISGKSLLTDDPVSLDLRIGITWLVSIDETSCDELFKLISLANSQDFECEISGLLYSPSHKSKLWAQQQGMKIHCILPEDPSLQSYLGVQKIPWFTCIENSRITYSEATMPTDLTSIRLVDEDLPELKSPQKLGNEEDMLQSLISGSAFKLTTEIPGTSLSINKLADTELERALKKVQKLKNRVKQQEQTIEDYKTEVKQLRSLLLAKNSEYQSSENSEKKPVGPPRYGQNSEPAPKKSIFQSNKNKKNSIQNMVNMRLEENDFWKIEDTDDFQESTRFEDIAASKDLWLIGLFKSQKETGRPIKAAKVLPPLQVDRQRQAKSLRRDITNKNTEKKPNFSNIPGLSTKKIIRNQ